MSKFKIVALVVALVMSTLVAGCGEPAKMVPVEIEIQSTGGARYMGHITVAGGETLDVGAPRSKDTYFTTKGEKGGTMSGNFVHTGGGGYAVVTIKVDGKVVGVGKITPSSSPIVDETL